MKEIPLTQGQVALIDDDMFDRISRFKWYAEKHPCGWYARATLPFVNGKWPTVLMHQLIMGMPDSFVDHINHNGIDNRIENLRLATCRQNGMNRRKQKGTSSIYKGVCWHKKYEKWESLIKLPNGQREHLGMFDKEHENMAAFAYDLAAMEHYGEFAKLNLSIYNQL